MAAATKREKVLVAWSGGKDSARALHEILASRLYQIAALLTTVTEDYDRISMHGVRRVLLEQQAASLGLRLEQVMIPKQASNEVYESRMADALRRYKEAGVTSVVFGDIFLEDLKKYREKNLAGLGMKGIFPLWKRDTVELMKSFIGLGFHAVTVCVDTQALDRRFVGRKLDQQFVSDLPSTVDPCGENGEYHSFVYGGPIFARSIPYTVGEVVLRDDRFCYCDFGAGGLMLKIESLTVAYDSRRVLQDVSLNVQSGEVMALVGPNGGGKSTLVRAISGVVPIQHGNVLIDGKSLSQLSTVERARYLAVVPQARSLPPAFTVYELVLLGRTPYLGWLGRASPRDHERVHYALERTQLLPLAERHVGELSGGEQQRVLLARALAQDTPVLLLDEPTTYLDLQHRESLIRLIRDLALHKNLAVLMVLHDLNLAGLYADRVVLLVQGQVTAAGTPLEVLTETNLSWVYQIPVRVIRDPEYGNPLILPDGRPREAS